MTNETSSRSSGISSLPSEILCRIFLELRDSVNEEDLWTPLAANPLTWAIVTHVCRRWRTLAIEYPILWTQIDFGGGLAWMKEMVLRSKDLPIFVNATPTQNHTTLSRAEPILSGILSEHLHRTEELILTGSSPILWRLLSSLSRAAPLLRKLELQVCNNNFTDESTFINDLPMYFLTNTPQLRRLKLTECYVPWGSRLYDGITELQITFTGWSFIAPSPRDFLQALARMPGLTTLSILVDYFKFGINTIPATDNIVEFRALQNLRIDATCDESTSLLVHLKIPTSTQVTLRCDEASDESNVVALRSAMTSAWLSAPLATPDSTSHSVPMQTLKIESGKRNFGVCIQGWSHEAFADPEPHQVDPEEYILANPLLYLHLRSSTGFDMPSDRSPRRWSAAMEDLPLGDVQVLDAPFVPDDYEGSCSILGRMTSLRRINLHSTALTFFLDILQSPAYPDLPASSTNLYLPNLEAITITESQVVLAALLEFVTWRSDSGVKLKTLWFNQCEFIGGERTVDALRAIVDHVGSS